MEYYIASFIGGLILLVCGIVFQRILDQPIKPKGLFRDFLVGLGVVAGIFYAYPETLRNLNIPTTSSDLDLQVG